VETVPMVLTNAAIIPTRVVIFCPLEGIRSAEKPCKINGTEVTNARMKIRMASAVRNLDLVIHWSIEGMIIPYVRNSDNAFAKQNRRRSMS
jgi:hypothetical protein